MVPTRAPFSSPPTCTSRKQTSTFSCPSLDNLPLGPCHRPGPQPQAPSAHRGEVATLAPSPTPGSPAPRPPQPTPDSKPGDWDSYPPGLICMVRKFFDFCIYDKLACHFFIAVGNASVQGRKSEGSGGVTP
jgi:hypothetical protein